MVVWWLWASCVLSVDGSTVFGQPIDRVVIDVGRSDVTIVGMRGPVVVDADVGGWSEGDVRTVVEDGVLFVDYTCGQSEWCGGDLRVEMPPDTPVQTSLLSGDLRLADLDADVLANLREGRLTIRGNGPGPVVVAANGTVDLEFDATPSRVDVETAQGDVRLVLPEGDYALDLEARQIRSDDGIRDDPDSGNVLRIRTPDAIRMQSFFSPPPR